MHILRALAILPLFSIPALLHAADLPPDVDLARHEVIRISAENTLRTDNIPEVREALTPHLHTLAEWFAANRPASEVALTQQPWKNLWYDDPDIEAGANLDLGFITIKQDRDKIFQVVRDGFYYNVSESTLTLFGISFPIQNFLKGAYTVTNPAGPGNAGEQRLNVVNLEFVANSIFPLPLFDFLPLNALVTLVDRGLLRTIAVPGPLGVTGELWNLYVDEEIRISAGFDDSEPDVLDLYILRRADST